VAIDVKANVWPLVPPNTANSTMLDSNPADAKAPEAAQRTESAHALPA
jgi:acetolactate synthase-1/2/3 large subunit